MQPLTQPTSRWAPAVTVAAVVEHAGRYLLVQERTARGLRLNNPAGHLEPGEALIDAVRREVLEETARHFTPEALVGIYQAKNESPTAPPQAAYLRVCFCGSVSEPEPGRALDEPIVQTLWLTLDELRADPLALRSDLVLRCIEDHAAGARHALAALQSLLLPSP